MKKIILLFAISIFLFSCKVSERPEFIKVNSVKLINASHKSFTIQANLQFENKNSVGGTLQAKDIHVFIDNIDVATINTELFKVPKKSEFELPLQTTIPFDKIYKDNKEGILNNVLNILSSKKVMIDYKGDVRYELGAFHYNYPVDCKQEIELTK